MYRYVKRIADVGTAVVLLVVLSPLLLVLAILVKLESAGPVFFSARRIGKDEKEFNIYKFRTMFEDAPVLPPNKFVDPSRYITRVGGFLRRKSLDELPQLVNILKGEMSFIGPRPGAAKNEEELRRARRRAGVFSVLPGVTGWAQVNGRDKLAHDVKKKTHYDKQYVDNFGLRLDFLIALMTFRVVGTGDGYQEGALDHIVDTLDMNEELKNDRITFTGRVVRRVKRDISRIKSQPKLARDNYTEYKKQAKSRKGKA